MKHYRLIIVRVGFFQGDIKLLLDDVATLRPTIFPMVPRLINRMYDKVKIKFVCFSKDQ